MPEFNVIFDNKIDGIDAVLEYSSVESIEKLLLLWFFKYYENKAVLNVVLVAGQI